MKSTEIPTAMEMVEKIDFLSRLLLREQLIDYRSKSHLDKVSTQLKKCPNKTKTWAYSIHASRPIEFVPIKISTTDQGSDLIGAKAYYKYNAIT
ncbi:MAG: hypothetical protein DRR16_06350 [Candidatus Parabeggiatoa sp. nov. 3]|nr:MAG: hypothetical protein DRR16_06350 [Gammaproteobacteria bacterium]